MKNEGKLGQLRVLIDRITKNVKDIENLDMAGLSPWWPTLEQKALTINEDLRILLPLAAEVKPLMVKEIISLKEAVVNMRIDSYNLMNDVTAGEHQDPELYDVMKAHGFKDHYSQRAQDFCVNECPYQARCLASKPAGQSFL